MKTFDTFEEVADMLPCRKKPVIVHAKKMSEPFRVKTLEGCFNGKAGDYLIRGIKGELYIHDGPIFEEVYDFVDLDKNAIKKE